MFIPDQILQFLFSIPMRELALGIVAVSALLLILEERRLSVFPLFAQYIFVALLIGPHTYRPLALIRLGLGLVVCLMLFVSASHVQPTLYSLMGSTAPGGTISRSPWMLLLRSVSLTGFGLVFRLIVVAVSILLGYGMWRNYPIPPIATEINLAIYWLILSGLFITVTSSEPLRMGFGLLTLVSGFETLYLMLEKSFLVAGLLNVLDVILTLAIIICAEMWLESLRRQALT